jgi:hypothetical protein
MNDETTKQKPKARAIAKPHSDPWLFAFLVGAVIYIVARLAAAQEIAPACPPVPSGTIFGIPITDLINVGVPACLTVYLVVKGLPDMTAKFSTEQTTQRVHDQKTADELRAEIGKLGDRLDRALDRGPTHP